MKTTFIINMKVESEPRSVTLILRTLYVVIYCVEQFVTASRTGVSYQSIILANYN